MAGRDHRRIMTDKYAEGTLDLMRVDFFCASCKEAVPDRTLRTVGDVSYEDIDGLVALAGRVLKDKLKETEDCPRCGKQAKARAVDWHSFTGGRDLVVRLRAPEGWLRKAPPPELLWWDGETHAPAAPTAAERERFARDARFRRVQAQMELQGFDKTLPALEALAGELAGDAVLMRHVPRLVARGRTALAGRILEAQLAARPDDPEAHYWMAEVVLKLVNGKAWGLEHLSEAEEHLNKTLELAPAHRAAPIGLSTLYRLRDQPEKAVEVLERLLAVHPDDGLAHYNLGAMYLDGDPARALTHFEAGEKSDAEDPDYPIGMARALVALGRRDEARAALERARKLDAKHPRIAELEAALR